MPDMHAGFQDSFAHALRNALAATPDGLTTWNGSNPARRFAVYRNNVAVAMIDALADTFPVCLELVGDDFFRAMARAYVGAHPPRSPVMAAYGLDDARLGGAVPFADFVGSFAPAAALPYLADVARLEALRAQALIAADAEPITAAELVPLLDDAEGLPHVRLVLHPALGVLRARHAAVSLWAAHQLAGTDDPAAIARTLATIDTTRAEAALVVRPALDADVVPVTDADACFVAGLQARLPLGRAVEQAIAIDPAFDLVTALALLMRFQLIVAIHRASA